MIQGTISGVYNYCDRWCERCRFQQRCDVFSDLTAMESSTYVPPQASTPAHCDNDTFLEFELTPEEELQAEKNFRLREERTAAHPISLRAMEYLRAVRPARSGGVESTDVADPILMLARETVRQLALPISAKSRRAVHELVDGDEDVVDRTLDPRGIQSDGNGSAKVVRLLIRESIDAWRVIHNAPAGGPGSASGMIRVLEALDVELNRAFPFALEFVRPGFDE